ncbi:polymer-forming cytoskeletal protein (plasmid) [Natrinema thermotolerans]|uniref:Polymer-forming cytoskeletal protein n=1 Tax=Natrinema thermotolerans TaxID=121872 RepID=A0AAF0PIX3_9EURY|nr:polymer-forming cytoskeletal protein [Natrinema thermotolerans]WMT10299.1 polymer-forming cytoskeletal protein [Natrinema thermotolerans]
MLLGAGLIGTGLTSTDAFSNLNASRSTEIQTASDPNALLGIVDRSSSAQLNSSGSATIYGLDDNANAFYKDDISATVMEVTDATGDVDDNPGLTADIAAGSQEDYNVDMICDNDGGTTLNGQYEVTVELTVSSNPAVVATRTTDSQVSITCKDAYTVPDNGKEKGSIETGKDVTVGNNGQVKGDVESGGTVTLGQNAQIKEDVESGGNVTLGQGAQIKGDVESGGNVTLGQGAQIKGDVESGGILYIGCNAQVKGEKEAADVVFYSC